MAEHWPGTRPVQPGEWMAVGEPGAGTVAKCRPEHSSRLYAALPHERADINCRRLPQPAPNAWLPNAARRPAAASPGHQRTGGCGRAAASNPAARAGWPISRWCKPIDRMHGWTRPLR